MNYRISQCTNFRGKLRTKFRPNRYLLFEILKIDYKFEMSIIELVSVQIFVHRSSAVLVVVQDLQNEGNVLQKAAIFWARFKAESEILKTDVNFVTSTV